MPKPKTLLPLAPVVSAPATLVPRASGFSILSSGQRLSRPEQQVVEEWRVEALVIEGTAAKARLALERLRQVHEYAEAVFDQTAGNVLAVKQQAGRLPEHQAYVDEFTTRNLQLAGGHFLGTVSVAAAAIGAEVARSLYPSPEPEDRRGVLRRLLG